MTEEIFDICDADDQVIGQATRSQVHAQGLLHRAVHIWVWRSDGTLLVHLRSPHKDEYPNTFTSSASGHVDHGEDYLTAAQRELREELGMTGDLTFVCKLPAGPETANEHTVLYELRTDAPARPDPIEISEVLNLGPQAIWELLEATPERFSPPFRALFEDWWSSSCDDSAE